MQTGDRGNFEVEREQESASAATPKTVGSGRRDKMGPETRHWARHEPPRHAGTTVLGH